VLQCAVSPQWLDCCPGYVVHHPRPGRFPGFTYVGYSRYFLTICASRPGAPFRDGPVAESVLEQLRRALADEQFALLAYCFMPDHVHLVLEGLSDTADLCRLVSRWKQITGYWYRRRSGRPLWWSGYHDHVLRDDESTADFVRYVLENPLKAGLAKRVGEFRFAGSDVFSEEEIREMVMSVPGERA